MRLSPEEARARFAASRVARLGTAGTAGVPHVVPVTFAVHGDVIVFAVDHKPKVSVALRRLENIHQNPAVCFLADGYDEDWSRLWWSRADGIARVLDDPADREGPLEWLREKYPQYAERPPEHAVVSTLVHAWRGWSAAT
jgi:PPOX class probable F420-dependent enzyme